MIRVPFLVAFLPVVLPISTIAGDGQKITEERLNAAYADAQKAIAKELSASLEQLPRLKISDALTLAKAVAAENLPMIRLRQPDEEKAKTAAKQAGAQLATFAYAKYAWSTKEFLVVPANWEGTARIAKRPELTGDEALRAVMVHELCHALDDRAHDFDALLRASPNTDTSSALCAVIEGHAQHRARRVCAAAGWSRGFESFTESIGALPEDAGANGEAQKRWLEAQSANASFAYREGERFVAAIEKAAGNEALGRVFRSPPQDTETILNPAWYLDPKSRPAQLYDAEPALDKFAAAYDGAVWSSQRVSLNGAQLGASLNQLPKEEMDAIVASIRATRVIQLYPTADPSSKVALLAVIEFDGESSASSFVEASARLSKLKDESMSKGTLRITGSKSTALERKEYRGWLQEKTMVNGTLEFQFASIDACRGRIVVETIMSGEPLEREAHEELIGELHDAVKLKR